MLNLDFTSEQDMLREMVRGVCSSAAGLDVVRAMEDDPVGYPADLWKQLGELDLIGLTIPEEYGGSGMGGLEAAVIYEEFGRSLAPSPHLVSAVLAGGALLRAGSAEQKTEWLPRIASGEAVFSVAWLEPENGFGPAGVQLRAVPDGDDLVLNGVKRHVYFAAAAERLLVLVRTGDAPTDVGLLLVDPKASGVELTQQFSISSDTQYRATFTDVRVPAAAKLGAVGSGWSAWDDVMHDGAILAAARAVGGARHSLDLTVQYAKDREQFGKQLGAFQALAHNLADAKTRVDGATFLVHEAAWTRAQGRDVAKLAPMAKLFACQTFRDVTARAQQIFGGVGFTVEYDIQLYFRRAKQLQLSWWNDRECEERIAAAVLD